MLSIHTLYSYFWSKVNIWIVNCARAQHSFSTHGRVFLWKCQSFWDRKRLDLRGIRTPNLGIRAKCSNLLSHQGQTFAVPCFEHWLWWYRYFRLKVNIWKANCARAIAFIFDTRTGVLVKVSEFWDRKCPYATSDQSWKFYENISCLPNVANSHEFQAIYKYIYIYICVYGFLCDVIIHWSQSYMKVHSNPKVVN